MTGRETAEEEQLGFDLGGVTFSRSARRCGPLISQLQRREREYGCMREFGVQQRGRKRGERTEIESLGPGRGEKKERKRR